MYCNDATFPQLCSLATRVYRPTESALESLGGSCRMTPEIAPIRGVTSVTTGWSNERLGGSPTLGIHFLFVVSFCLVIVLNLQPALD
jgi:hypothetical protein